MLGLHPTAHSLNMIQKVLKNCFKSISLHISGSFVNSYHPWLLRIMDILFPLLPSPPIYPAGISQLTLQQSMEFMDLLTRWNRKLDTRISKLIFILRLFTPFLYKQDFWMELRLSPRAHTFLYFTKINQQFYLFTWVKF